jgi:hypothetical protein
MPIEFRPNAHYESGAGPTRNGATKLKPAIYPTEAIFNQTRDTQVIELVMLAHEVITWGQERWVNDHGSLEDHQHLVDFVNLSLALVNPMVVGRMASDG